QEKSIINPVGISGSDQFVLRRYNFSFGISMATHTITVFGGIFGQSANTQAFGLALGVVW
ncbi:hypothetical protein KI387_005481, partial [Taxus chinensis]